MRVVAADDRRRPTAPCWPRRRRCARRRSPFGKRRSVIGIPRSDVADSSRSLRPRRRGSRSSAGSRGARRAGRRSRAPTEWNVPAVIRARSAPRRPSTRRVISCAARFVKVRRRSGLGLDAVLDEARDAVDERPRLPRARPPPRRRSGRPGRRRPPAARRSAPAGSRSGSSSRGGPPEDVALRDGGRGLGRHRPGVSRAGAARRRSRPASGPFRGVSGSVAA